MPTHAGRFELLVGFAVAGASFAIGVLIGGLAGFLRGWIDDALMRPTKLVLSLRRFFLALVVAGSSLTSIALLVPRGQNR